MTKNTRKTTVKIDEQFLERWSPRSFNRNKEVSREQLLSIIEAARWAPSCFNDQPWLFIHAQGSRKEELMQILVPDNQSWAKDAPLLIFIAARRNFKHNNKPNRHASFDSGAAWMSLTLQANKLGLYTHAMAGIDYEKGAKMLNLTEDQELICAVAIGYQGDGSNLNEKQKSLEQPNQRVELNSILFEGSL